MATIGYTTQEVDGGVLVTWANIATGDTCVAYQPRGDSSLAGSVQFQGTAVTSVALRQSNDFTNYHNVKDVTGTDIALTAAGMRDFSSAARWLRPLVTTGTAVTCTMFLRG